MVSGYNQLRVKLHRILPHPLTPYPEIGEGELDSYSLPDFGEGTRREALRSSGWGSLLCNFILNWY
jgi:hypothetical protein